MKISKWVDMGQEVEIEIGVDDIRCALAEAFAAVTTEKHAWLGEEPPNSNDVIRALSSIGSFLRAMTDEQISLLNDAQRLTIAGFLSEQTLRYQAQPVGSADLTMEGVLGITGRASKVQE